VFVCLVVVVVVVSCLSNCEPIRRRSIIHTYSSYYQVCLIIIIIGVGTKFFSLSLCIGVLVVIIGVVDADDAD